MYNEFSAVYDRLIGADYEKFISYYRRIFDRYDQSPRLIADLGCGTGTLAGLMQKAGYDMIGVDSSAEMLAEAKLKFPNILFLNQDMTEFELYGTVDTFYSSLDCINYILDIEQLAHLFALVNNYLNYGGLYIFDISSRYKLTEILGNNSFVFEEDNVFYTWENFFENDLLSMNLTFFEKKGDLYKRFDEEQTQRAYTRLEITNAAEKAGLRVLGVFDEFSFDEPRNDSERIFFVLQRIPIL